MGPWMSSLMGSSMPALALAGSGAKARAAGAPSLGINSLATIK